MDADDYELENAQLWVEERPSGRKAARATKKPTAAAAANSHGQVGLPLGSLIEINGSSPQHTQPRSLGLQSAPGRELSGPSSPSSATGSLRRDPVADQRFYTDPNFAKQPLSPRPQRYRGRETSGNVNRRLNQVYYSNSDAQGVLGHSVFAVPNIYSFPGAISGETDAPGEIEYEGLDGFVRDSDADKRAREGIRPDGSAPLVSLAAFHD